MATDEREFCYFGVLNEIYLQNFLHGWVVNHETNLMSILNFGVLNKIYLQNLLYGWVANHETNLMSILTS